jgi:hypothetical protein
MKSERRHELQHNELSDQMGAMAERVRPYTAGIAISVIAILVALMLYSFWMGQQRTQNAEAWEAYFAATQSIVPNMEKLAQVAEQFPKDDVGLWARIMLADHQLAEGSEELFTDRAKANANLAKAVENYTFVIDSTRADALRERADIGLARAYEGQGQLEKARQRYQILVQDASNSPFAFIARERLEELEMPRTKEFYDWFVKQDPKPSGAGAPATGEPLDFNFDKLPEAPASSNESMLKLPDFPVGGGAANPLDVTPNTLQPSPDGTPDATPAEPTLPATKEAAPSETPTASSETSAPATGTPPAETPSADPQPATEAPATP